MERLLTEAEVSELTGIPRQGLRKDRWRGRGIPYLKVGRRVRYKADALRDYLERCRHRSTSDQPIEVSHAE